MQKSTKRVALLALGLALPLFMIGCAAEPTTEIDAADAALESARQAEAQAYAPDAMQVAEDAHAELETELAKQKERFVLSRSYDQARQLAVEAKRASEDAVDAAQVGRQQAREDATAMLSELRTSLAEVETMLDNAPKGKGSAADLAALKGDLGAVDVSLIDIEHAISTERFLDAVQKAQAALENTNEIRSEIERAAKTQQAARSRRG